LNFQLVELSNRAFQEVVKERRRHGFGIMITAILEFKSSFRTLPALPLLTSCAGMPYYGVLCDRSRVWLETPGGVAQW